ncbi:MAG: hypothetical protein ACMUIL_11965 [bacterium]
MAERYKLLFHGETVEGQDCETVKRNLAALFRIDAEKINRLFSTLPITIKKDVDRATAEQYRNVLEKAGALCRIEPMEEDPKMAPSPQEQPEGQRFQYEVVFYGECIKGFPFPAVKQGLADIYKTDLEKIDELLSRLPVVVKRNVDLETATHYQGMMRQIGANCLIRPILPPQGQSGTGPCRTEKGAGPASPSAPAEAQHTIQHAGAATPVSGNGAGNAPSDRPVRQADAYPLSSPEQGMPASAMTDPGGHEGRLHVLFHVGCTVRREMQKVILGSAVIGGIAGYMWGGLYDPWGGSGMAAAVLNLFLFGGWACVESFALVCARDLLRVRSRSWLIAAGATVGGLWVGVFSALRMSANPLLPGSLGTNMAFGLIVGMLIGIAISALYAVGMSGMVLDAAEESGSVREPHRRPGPFLAWKVLIGCGVGCILLVFVVLTALAFFFG